MWLQKKALISKKQHIVKGKFKLVIHNSILLKGILKDGLIFVFCVCLFLFVGKYLCIV